MEKLRFTIYGNDIDIMNKPTYRGELSEFCSAIVEQAVVDWMYGYLYMLEELGGLKTKEFIKKYFHKLSMAEPNKNKKANIYMLKSRVMEYFDADEFFGTDWYYELTDVSAEYLRREMKDFVDTYFEEAKKEEDYERGQAREKFQYEWNRSYYERNRSYQVQ